MERTEMDRRLRGTHSEDGCSLSPPPTPISSECASSLQITDWVDFKGYLPERARARASERERHRQSQRQRQRERERERMGHREGHREGE